MSDLHLASLLLGALGGALGTLIALHVWLTRVHERRLRAAIERDRQAVERLQAATKAATEAARAPTRSHLRAISASIATSPSPRKTP